MKKLNKVAGFETHSGEKNDFNTPCVHYAVMFVVCFFSFFVNNQVIPADLMESRNLATAQEMVQKGNYLLPTMNGEPRLEKPPLPTWIAAEIEIVFPGNLVAQRCATGLVGTLMVVFLYLLVFRLTRNRLIGLMASLVLASCFNVIIMARTATWDIYCHSFMLGAIYFMISAFEQKGSQWKNFIFAGIFLGLSFLGKGPVSFYALFLPFIISYFIVYRPKVSNKGIPLTAMIVICLVISCWWTLYVYFFHRDTALYVAVKESSSWINRNVRPWYYYWQFPAEAGIWALFLVTSLVGYFVNKKPEFRKEYTFSIIWFLASLVLLSVIPEKKTRYLLPILIPGAMLVAFYLYHSFKGLNSMREKLFFRINTILIAAILIAIPFVLYLMFYKESQLSLVLLILSTVISWSLSAYLFYSLFGTKGIRVMPVFTAIILTMVMVEVLCLIPVGHLFINEERHSIRMVHENTNIQGLPFYYNQDEELRIELVYEANQVIRPINLSHDSIYNNMPFVLLSGCPIDSLFDGRNVNIEHIGTFDNNWRKTGHKRYNWNLVREVAIIRSNSPSGR